MERIVIDDEDRAKLARLRVLDLRATQAKGLNFLEFHPGIRLEPFTLHPQKAGALQLSALGYMSYTSSWLEGAVVGRYSSIAGNVRVMGRDHPTDWVSTHIVGYSNKYKDLIHAAGFIDWDPVVFSAPRPPVLTIGNDVWIGRDAVLARGITIGDGAVIAGSAVVTRDVAPYAVVGGVPAKLIRYRFPEPLRERLIASTWWNHRVTDFGQTPFNQVEAFLDAVESGTLAPLPDMRKSPQALLSDPVPEGFGSAWL